MISIPLVLIATCYALFIGLQVPSGGGFSFDFILYVLLLFSLQAGLVVAWWREKLGAIIALAAVAGFVIAGLALGGFAEFLQTASPLSGPLHLFFALTTRGYHLEASPLARQVPWISWALVLIPILLFAASWLLRRESKAASESP